MNRANYSNIKKKYPLTTEGLDFIQNQILLVQELSKVYGDRYILREPTTAKSGACVIGGELFELRLGSGTGSSRIAIHEAQKTITANGEIYEEARTERYAIYTNDTNDIPKSDFVFVNNNHTVMNLQNTINDITLRYMPKGAIVMWHSINGTPPDGWHYCNGNNGTEINGVKIPDLRGRFVVGRNSSDNSDTDFDNDGKTGGEKSVTLTVEQMPKHSHTLNRFWNGATGAGGILQEIRLEDGNSVETSIAGGDKPHNNLPPYYVLSFIIKCF